MKVKFKIFTLLEQDVVTYVSMGSGTESSSVTYLEEWSKEFDTEHEAITHVKEYLDDDHIQTQLANMARTARITEDQLVILPVYTVSRSFAQIREDEITEDESMVKSKLSQP